MALLIKKDVNYKNIQLNEIYCRISLKTDFSGKKIVAYIRSYTSKDSFKENDDKNEIEISFIPKSLKIDWDQSQDLLTQVHDKVIDFLLQERSRTTNHTVIDPSTGEVSYDEEFYTILNAEDITIVDLD